MSIFQKTCPECAATNPTDAIACECGYAFDPEAVADANPAEYAHQQDQLYRDYLDARIAQAEAELTVAKGLATADPESTYKASSALLAEQALNALRAEMKQLSLRISAAARARPAPAVKRAPAAPTRPVSPPAHIATPRPAKTAVAPKPLPPPVHRSASASSAAPMRKPAAAVTPPMQPKPIPAPVNKPKAKPVATAHKVVSPPPPARTAAQPRRPTPTPLPAKTQPAPPKAASTAPPVNGKNGRHAPGIAARPNEDFRRAQSQKAEAIARSKAARAPVPAQSASADIPPLVSPKKEPVQECPNCTATLPANQMQCSCGYALARPGEEVPALTLDAGALAILTEGLSFNSSNRRR